MQTTVKMAYGDRPTRAAELVADFTPSFNPRITVGVLLLAPENESSAWSAICARKMTTKPGYEANELWDGSRGHETRESALAAALNMKSGWEA